MAATKVSSSKKTPRPRTKRAATSHSRPAHQRQRASKPRAELPVETVSAEVADKRVQDAATEAVTTGTPVMIENLAKKAESGDPVSIKTLLELMRAKSQPHPKPRRGSLDPLRRPVINWMTEPEWQVSEKPNTENAAADH